MSDDRSQLGESNRRAHRRYYFWWTSGHNYAPCLSIIQLEFWRLHRRHHGLRNDSGRGGHDWQSASRPDGYAAVLRLPHGRLLSTLDRMQRSLSETPRIFHVNWFRKDAEGKFIWPGFSENMRVLKWIVDRAHGRALAKETPIGWVPHYEDIEWKGLDFPKEKFDELQAFDRQAWREEVLGHEELFGFTRPSTARDNL